MLNAVFVDWLTASQYHFEGGLPIITGGIIVHYDESGVPRYERNCPASFPGSYDTSLRIGCDGFRVSVSGNVGRFARQDNLYNFGWEGTKEAVNRILQSIGLPSFSVSTGEQIHQDTPWRSRGAVVSRLDVTANYATGSEARARACIRHMAARSVARMKKGRAGDESVWWANTRHMLKAYIKHLEMAAHGTRCDDQAYLWCLYEGVVRVELELKKRLLSELKLNDWGDITQEKLEDVYRTQTELLRALDLSDDEILMENIPIRSRVYAAAWLAGRDMAAMANVRTLYRHAKILREHGIDIFAERENVKQFPTQVRFIDLVQLSVPDWYKKRSA